MISDFYANKTILLTGGTGFLGKSHYFQFCIGKVVLEKMLRSLPNIKTIYLAIQPNVSVDVINF